MSKENHKKKGFSVYWIYFIIALILLGIQLFTFQKSGKEITVNEFFSRIVPSGDVERLVVVNKEYVEVYIHPDSLRKPGYEDVRTTMFGTPNPGPHFIFSIGSLEHFESKLEEFAQQYPYLKTIPVKYVVRRSLLRDIMLWVVPIIILIVLWVFLMRRMAGPGGQIFSFGKTRARVIQNPDEVKVTFKDVAGLDEAKEEVKEIVDFLKNPKKYTALGGKIPKGVLLVGPPGTGKTLLAKAVAGEAHVPFFSVSGSEFVEMFVGVGASRVRDLFRQAREKAPCIVFIDEIDAIGRARGKYLIPGGNDERESTLNQLLVEMDGFDSRLGIIVMAATNRPDVLDKALLRPGRFDRQIILDRPDIKGREEIFKIHMRDLKVAPDVDVHKLALLTPGFVGADIANVCNEAALLAARRNKSQIEMEDFVDAIDKVIGGLRRKIVMSPEEKRVVAYHEAGHAVVSWMLKHVDPLYKVTIIPRAMGSLGFAQYLPKERYIYTKEQMLEHMIVALGGRAAEEIIFGHQSTGAQNDLERVTQIAYNMVKKFGMSEKLGLVAFSERDEEMSFQKPYSEETAKLIDEEVRKIVQYAYERALEILQENIEHLKNLAEELLKKEVLTKDEVEKIIGKPPASESHNTTQQDDNKQMEVETIDTDESSADGKTHTT